MKTLARFARLSSVVISPSMGFHMSIEPTSFGEISFKSIIFALIFIVFMMAIYTLSIITFPNQTEFFGDIITSLIISVAVVAVHNRAATKSKNENNNEIISIKNIRARFIIKVIALWILTFALIKLFEKIF